MTKKIANFSYESDGKMGKEKKPIMKQNEKSDKQLFFNSTQNSE
ncbi:hypothetical protein [uncultured Metabacillus sp.]|nr:hypothetical protein [uncultured Metabacillus sp.]